METRDLKSDLPEPPVSVRNETQPNHPRPKERRILPNAPITVAGSSSSGSSQGSGLGTGAKAGIGAGVGVGVLVVIVVVFMLVRKKRTPNQNRQQPLPQDMPEESDQGDQRTSSGIGEDGVRL